MDAAQRLSLLVVADAVEVEADGPPQQELPAVLGPGAAVEAEPLELHETRIDHQRLLVLERQAGLRQPERVRDRQADRLEAVPPSRHSAEAVGAPVASPAVRSKLDLLLTQPSDVLVGDDGRQRHAGLPREDELDPHVVPLEQVSIPPEGAVQPPAPGHARLPHRDPHPRNRERHDEDEPGRDRVERGRAEDDGDDPAEDAEGQYGSTPGGHQTGTGVCASASATSSARPSPAERASGARISRCASTGVATAFTSSGVT